MVAKTGLETVRRELKNGVYMKWMGRRFTVAINTTAYEGIY